MVESRPLEISRHAIQAMLGDAIRRGAMARGVLMGGEGMLSAAVPLDDAGAPPQGAQAVYVGARGDESARALRQRACGEALELAGLPLVVIRLGEAGRLEAALLDGDGRELPLVLREDGAAAHAGGDARMGNGTMPHAE